MSLVMTPLIRSTLWRFCGAASVAVLGLSPKAVSVASARVWPPPSVAPQLAEPKSGISTRAVPGLREAQHVSTRLRSGTLIATVSWALDDVTALDVLRGHIEFRPNPGPQSSFSTIRFIQVAKAERNGGLDYEWQGLEVDRNVLRTSSQMGVGIQSGYFVDHKASACVPATPCSPYFRDHWANARDSGDGFQAGWGFAPASLIDYPFGWDILEQITLESCARAVETGEFLGCAEWGARWPTQGGRSISPISVTEAPSQTFYAALRRFEDFYNPGRAVARPSATSIADP